MTNILCSWHLQYLESLWPPWLYLHSFTKWSLKTCLQGLWSCHTLPDLSCSLKPQNGAELHDICNLSFLPLTQHCVDYIAKLCCINRCNLGQLDHSYISFCALSLAKLSVAFPLTPLDVFSVQAFSFHVNLNCNKLEPLMSGSYFEVTFYIGSNSECHLSYQWSCSSEKSELFLCLHSVCETASLLIFPSSTKQISPLSLNSTSLKFSRHR